MKKYNKLTEDTKQEVGNHIDVIASSINKTNKGLISHDELVDIVMDAANEIAALMEVES